MAAVAAVVVVGIEMAVATILLLAFKEGGNEMLWRASAIVCPKIKSEERKIVQQS